MAPQLFLPHEDGAQVSTPASGSSDMTIFATGVPDTDLVSAMQASPAPVDDGVDERTEAEERRQCDERSDLGEWQDAMESHAAGEAERDLQEALELDNAALLEQESADLAAALVRSKQDKVPERVQLLRFTRCAGNAEVARILVESPLLAGCREDVAAAGCELRPHWAGGAWLFAPVAQEYLAEVDWALDEQHILVRSDDLDRLKAALRSLPNRIRPKVQLVAGTSEDAERDTECDHVDSPRIVAVAEHTFWNLAPSWDSLCSVGAAQSLP